VPNSWFQFKQFIIHQDQSAMKVGTDGVLLGAWANCSDARNILDIGSGTGLLALMCAQRSHAQVIGIEIDAAAAKQANNNAEGSIFRDRIKIVHQDLLKFIDENKQLFDYIICNPPYFELTSTQAKENRKLARQQLSLNYENLIESCFKLISNSGRCGIIFPFAHEDKICQLIQNIGFYVVRKTIVYPAPEKLPKRILLEFSKTKSEIVANHLMLESGKRHDYSNDFKALTKDFYL
jgi:tRNA1Val (adenine37-N6)-methyltransferase